MANQNYAGYLIAHAMEHLETNAEEHPYLEGPKLAAILRASPHPLLPPLLNSYLYRFLRGTIEKPKGRRKGGVLLDERNEFLIFRYRRYLSWLQKKEKAQSLVGWSCIAHADWWQGAVHERAAAMALERMRRTEWWNNFPTVSVRFVHNLSSSLKYRYIEVKDPCARF